MGAATVAAEPEGLRRYTQLTVAVDRTVEAAAATGLRSALDRFRDSRPEFGLPAPASTDAVLRWARSATEVDAEPHAIATRLEAADSAQVLWSPNVIRPRWTPERWLQPMRTSRWQDLVYGGATFCFVDGGRYDGSGAVVGPDGLLYPLVAPKIVVGDRIVEGTVGPVDRSVEDLDGQDPGWVAVDVREGVMRHLDEPATWERWIVALGIATNSGIAPTTTPVTAEDLTRLRVGRGGYPYLQVPTSPSLAPPPSVPMDLEAPGFVVVDGQQFQVDRQRLQEYPRDVRRSADHIGMGPRPAVTRANNAMAATDLLIGAGEGILVARSLGDGGLSGYQVVFEVHEDGRRRARFRTYRNYTDQQGALHTIPSHLGVDADGDLAFDDIDFLRGPTIGHAGTQTHLVHGRAELLEEDR